MKAFRRIPVVILMVAASLVAACSRPDSDSGASQNSAAALPAMIVHKTVGCGCCDVWIAKVRLAGYPVEVREDPNLDATRERLGIPAGKASCHTAEIDGYVVEGHVPVEDIQKLLRERPDARGLAVPGMPIGSPGMEAPDGSAQAYAVELVAQDGSTRVYSEYPAREAADDAASKPAP